jgi:glycosyltransferase involved in cell wall biosynthesis
MSKDINILFVHSQKSSFVVRDLDLLGRRFNIREVYFPINKDLKAIFNIPFKLAQFIRNILWADLTFSWLADLHAFIAVLLSKMNNKKSLVVVGGYEVAKVPELRYGALLNPGIAIIIKYIFKNADKMLVVNEGLKEDAVRNMNMIGNNIITVPTGYDYNLFKPEGNKENIILTVSIGSSWERAKLKGLDTFVETAKYLPQFNFILIGFQGPGAEKLKSIAPTNVQFIEQLPAELLISYYQKAKIYCQFSIREGLPNVLCEAMLCECIPIGSDIPGIRAAIGDTGFYVPIGEPKKCADTIQKAFLSDKGKEARNRIRTVFPLQRREAELTQIINELLN